MKRLIVIMGIMLLMIAFPVAVFADEETDLPVDTEVQKTENSVEDTAEKTINEPAPTPAVSNVTDNSNVNVEKNEDNIKSVDENNIENDQEVDFDSTPENPDDPDVVQSDRSFETKYPEVKNALGKKDSKGYVDISSLGIPVSDEDGLAGIAMIYGSDFDMIEKDGFIVGIRFSEDEDSDDESEVTDKKTSDKGSQKSSVSNVSSVTAYTPKIEKEEKTETAETVAKNSSKSASATIKGVRSNAGMDMDVDTDVDTDQPLGILFAFVCAGLMELKKLLAKLQ